MSNYISELRVSLNNEEEKAYNLNGFKKINVNLNEGTGDDIIYLWYKYGTEAITRVQVTFNYAMEVGLGNAKYTKINKDLNNGVEGDPIYLWYKKDNTPYDVPIVAIDVTENTRDEARKMADNWERLAPNLNRGAGGKLIHAWVKREKQTYICDVDATQSYELDATKFSNGYIRVDETTNKGAGGSPVYLWYRQTTDSDKALNFLQISTNDAQLKELQPTYNQVTVDLNAGTGKSQVYLWHKKDKGSNPIKAITLLVNTEVGDFTAAGLNVIKRNLNHGTGSATEYLCINQ